MKKENLLEVDDLILYETVMGSYLVPVIKARRKYVTIMMPGGYRLLLCRQTNGHYRQTTKMRAN
jgi:hypothetical protein